MNYLQVVSEREQAWTEVARQTVYIEPRPLCSTDWDILELARKKSTIREFARNMPLEIGSFKHEYCNRIKTWADKQTKTFGSAESSSFSNMIYKAFRADITLLHTAFYELGIRSSGVEVGLFTQPRVRCLHHDTSLAPEIVYLARVGAAPFEVVPSNLELTAEQKALTEQSGPRSDMTSEGRQKIFRSLRSQGVLQIAALNKVHMLMSCPYNEELGTLHVSSTPIRGGTGSAFFRAYGALKLG